MRRQKRCGVEGSTRFASEPTTTSSTSSGVASGGGELSTAGGHFEYAAEDLGVPGVPPDISVLLPWVDVDHHDDAPKPVTKRKPARPRKAKRANKPKPPAAASATTTSAPTTSPATTPAASTAKEASIPPDFAEKLAAMKASAFNAALMVHGTKGDRNSQYEMMHVLEGADDALTRKKMKEQFAAQGNGSLTDYLGKQKWDSAHGKTQALDLVSDKRDATTDKLAAMSPDKRADLEDKAAGWADKILNVTRGSDRDDSENADKIAAILGPRSPEEIEVIRKRIRLQTSGTKSTTVFEELDRTFTERDESIAMAGLGSDPVKVAQTQLVDAAAEGDPERIHAIAKQLGPESMWKLNASDPLLAGRVIASMPEDRRKEFSALMNGKQDVAEGARIAAMLQPVDMSDLSAADAMNGTAAKKMKQKEAQDPERLIAELSKSSPEELAAARKAWNEGGNGKSWDDLIATTFKDADPTVRMRIEAAANGDVVGEKALRLRQGMKTFDQNLIDGALANPDLESDDPKKRAAAEAERRALEQRLQLHDANEQRTTALLEGKSTENILGRSVDDQLSAYYERRTHHDTGSGADGPFGAVRDIAEKDERMAKIREKAAVDRYAAEEMWETGDARLSTKVRRAELSGDTTKKAEILEQAKKGTIESHDADYKRKFGNDRSMLTGPDLSEAKDVAKVFARMTGDDRPTEEIAAELVRENMNVGELRMQHVRETGALADRTREQRISQQTELRDLSESGWLAGEEQMRFQLGYGNRGSEDLHASSIALLQQSGGTDVDDREFQRRDTSTTKALELQREEKQKSAASVAQALSIAGKIAALLTANPALFVAVDAGFSAARIAAQELIANEAYEATDDIKHMAVDMAVNIATAKLASLGKGLEAGSQAAKSAQTMQRIGNAGAAMGGAAAHSMIDGEEDGGGAVLRAAIGAILPGYFRGKAENAIKGTSRGANIAREGLGTVVDTASNVVIGGGHIDAGTAIDAIGGTVQGRLHGGHRKATAHEHGAMATHQVSDIDVPRRSASSDDAIRYTNTTEVDPRRSQRESIEDHARDVEARRRAETASQTQVHVVDEPSFEVPRQTVTASSAPGAGTTRSDTPASSGDSRTVSPRLPAENSVAPSARTTQPMEAVVPPSERITERMTAVRAPDEGPDAAALARAWERSTERERDRPTSYGEAIDRSTGVDKGTEYDQFRRDMAEMYANQEIEAQNVTRIQGRPTEAKKDGTYYVGNTDYDVRRFSYDNGDLTSVTLDAHLRAGAGITPEHVEAVKRSAYQGVDQIMNRDAEGKRHTLPDGSKLQVEPFFHDDASSAAHVVDVVQPFDERGKRLPSNQARWALPDVLNPNGAAHELVGHGMGLRDRYVDPETWFRDHPDAPGVTHDGNFMETVGPGASLKQHQLDQLGRDIATAERANASTARAVSEATIQRSEPPAMPPSNLLRAGGAESRQQLEPSGAVIAPTAMPRSDGTLSEKRVRESIVNELALATPPGSKAVDQNTVRVPVGDRHVQVGIEVGPVEGGQSSLHQTEDGSYRLRVSDNVADADVTRAVAHGTVAIQRQAEPPGSDAGKRPPVEVEGRAAELRVVFAQVDQRGVRHDERAETSRGGDVSSLLGTLGVDGSPEGRARLREALAFDPALLRRAELHLDGYEPRHDLDARSDLRGFGAQRKDRIAHLEEHIQGPRAEALRQVEDLSLGAQLRMEEGHRIFDGANIATDDPTAKKQLRKRQQAIVDTMNDPHLSPEQRRARLSAQIDALGADPALHAVRDKIDLEGMQKAAAGYGMTGSDHGTMGLDLQSGLVRMPGADPSDPPTTIRDVMRKVDAANQAAVENGLGVNYVVVVHQPVKDTAGSEMSSVEIVARKQPRSRHVDQSAPKVPGNDGHGDLVVDHGVGRGGFAIESATVPEGGMIVQTDHISKAHAGQMSRKNAGITDAAPLTAPGSVTMFADLLMHPEILRGAAHEPDAGIRQSFVNNVSAHFTDEQYQQFAQKLAEHMPEGSTVEFQWTMSSEREGGKRGDRGHVDGDVTAEALSKTGRDVSSIEADVVNGDYTIDAATRAAADPDDVGKFVPPTPEERRVITFGRRGSKRPGPEDDHE